MFFVGLSGMIIGGSSVEIGSVEGITFDEESSFSASLGEQENKRKLKEKIDKVKNADNNFVFLFFIF